MSNNTPYGSDPNGAGPYGGTPYGSGPYGSGPQNGSEQNPHEAPTQQAPSQQGQPDPNAQWGHAPQQGQDAYGAQQPYGSQQQNPYGQQGYGDQQGYPQQGYQQQPYGQAGYPDPAYGAPVQSGLRPEMLAGWWTRVGAYLIDWIIAFVPLVILTIIAANNGGFDTNVSSDSFDPNNAITDTGWAYLGVGFVLALAIRLWNEGYRQGKTAQSIGKRVLNIAVVDQEAGVPIGVGRGFGRVGFDYVINMASSVFSILFFVPLLNYLWPLWDAKNQTWSDKVVKSVVIKHHG